MKKVLTFKVINIWEKVKNNIKKEFESKPVYNEKYLKVKTKSYNGKISRNFHNKEVPKEGSQFICLSIILIDPVFITNTNYYPQVSLEECKYAVKEKKIPKNIIDDIEFLLILIEKLIMKEILMMKILIKKVLMRKVLIKKIQMKKIKNKKTDKIFCWFFLIHKNVK